LLLASFAMQKLFSLIWNQLFIFAFIAWDFGVVSKNTRPVFRSFSHMVSSRNFISSGFKFLVFCPFELFCVWYKIRIQFYCCICRSSVCHLLKRLSIHLH
jgi:hypothetical protein